jgi:hypothetical protein
MADTEELLEMRCRACGVFMGYRKRIGRFVFWCSEPCANTPMAKFPESQVRDEMIVELFLGGLGIMEISRALDDWPYQYVQQTLNRRGLNEERRTVASQKGGDPPRYDGTGASFKTRGGERFEDQQRRKRKAS